MPDPEKKPKAEAKRLFKSAKRRRRYAEQLRQSAREHETPEPALAERLERLAASEYAEAAMEERSARELEARTVPPPFSRNPHATEQAERAMAAMKGRFAIDRAERLSRVHRAGLDRTAGMGAVMAAVEARLGIDHGADAPLMGRRLAIAEEASLATPEGMAAADEA